MSWCMRRHGVDRRRVTGRRTAPAVTTTLAGTLTRTLVTALAAGSLAALSACSPDPNSIAEQAKAGDDKGFVSGDGSLQKIAPDKRGDPVVLAGPLLGGGAWDIASAADKVVILNTWASWCPPCREETPDLIAAWAKLSAAKKPVVLLGISVRDSDETALAYLKANAVTYPSLAAADGTPLLALQGKAPSLPTTLVLDRSHRIAARINGPVSVATLTGLTDDILAEKS